jgi:hypothetical protein
LYLKTKVSRKLARRGRRPVAERRRIRPKEGYGYKTGFFAAKSEYKQQRQVSGKGDTLKLEIAVHVPYLILPTGEGIN